MPKDFAGSIAGFGSGRAVTGGVVSGPEGLIPGGIVEVTSDGCVGMPGSSSRASLASVADTSWSKAASTSRRRYASASTRSPDSAKAVCAWSNHEGAASFASSCPNASGEPLTRQYLSGFSAAALAPPEPPRATATSGTMACTGAATRSKSGEVCARSGRFLPAAPWAQSKSTTSDPRWPRCLKHHRVRQSPASPRRCQRRTSNPHPRVEPPRWGRRRAGRPRRRVSGKC